MVARCPRPRCAAFTAFCVGRSRKGSSGDGSASTRPRRRPRHGCLSRRSSHRRGSSYLKKHQRMLGGLYQSVLRNELAHRLGVEWGPIVNGQAEIAGVPKELLAVFSKRAAAIDVALGVKLDEFRQRERRDPSSTERAAMTREAAVNARGRKSGHGAPDLVTRWRDQAAQAGWTVEQLLDGMIEAAGHPAAPVRVTVGEVVETVSEGHSSWGRPDVCRRSVTCSVPCRRCRDAAGSTASSGPPTGCSNTVSISTHPT